MRISRKEKSSTHNLLVCNQLVKLTKQNQYLHVKVEALYQQIDHLFRTKEKYKNKYRVTKQLLKQRQLSNQEQIRRDIQESDKNSKQVQSENDDQVSPQPNPQPYFESLEEIIYKVHENVNEISEKLQKVMKVLRIQQNPYLMNRVSRVGQTLNSILFKIRANEQQNYLQMSSQKQRVKWETDKIPERDTGKKISNIGKFVESKSQRQFVVERGENPQKKSEEEEKSENWKLLQEIGKELKNWRFSLSDEEC